MINNMPIYQNHLQNFYNEFWTALTRQITSPASAKKIWISHGSHSSQTSGNFPNRSWAGVKHNQRNVYCNIAFSGDSTTKKGLKIEIYVDDTTNKDQMKPNSWFNFIHQQLIRDLHTKLTDTNLDFQHAHGDVSAWHAVGTYRIFPDPINDTRNHRNTSLPSPQKMNNFAKHYGLKHPGTGLQQSIGIQKCGNAGRIVIWHPKIFDLTKQDDMDAAANWFYEMWNIWYPIMLNN